MALLRRSKESAGVADADCEASRAGLVAAPTWTRSTSEPWRPARSATCRRRTSTTASGRPAWRTRGATIGRSPSRSPTSIRPTGADDSRTPPEPSRSAGAASGRSPARRTRGSRARPAIGGPRSGSSPRRRTAGSRGCTGAGGGTRADGCPSAPRGTDQRAPPRRGVVSQPRISISSVSQRARIAATDGKSVGSRSSSVAENERRVVAAEPDPPAPLDVELVDERGPEVAQRRRRRVDERDVDGVRGAEDPVADPVDVAERACRSRTASSSVEVRGGRRPGTTSSPTAISPSVRIRARSPARWTSGARTGFPSRSVRYWQGSQSRVPSHSTSPIRNRRPTSAFTSIPRVVTLRRLSPGASAIPCSSASRSSSSAAISVICRSGAGTGRVVPGPEGVAIALEADAGDRPDAVDATRIGSLRGAVTWIASTRPIARIGRAGRRPRVGTGSLVGDGHAAEPSVGDRRSSTAPDTGLRPRHPVAREPARPLPSPTARGAAADDRQPLVAAPAGAHDRPRPQRHDRRVGGARGLDDHADRREGPRRPRPVRLGLLGVLPRQPARDRGRRDPDRPRRAHPAVPDRGSACSRSGS